MNNQVVNIFNKANRGNRPYNILTFSTHERYQSQLAKTGHNFYAFTYPECKEWVDAFAKRPDNYYVLPDSTLFQGLHYDFILSQSRFGQIQMARRLQEIVNVPILALEHTLPLQNWPEEHLHNMQAARGDLNVYISEHSAKEWGDPNGRVIHHSVDTELFKPTDVKKHSKVLSVVNDFINRDYCCNYYGWKRITNGLETHLVGDTKGLSKPAENEQELAKEYQSAQIFLNTSTLSPIPTSLLEAMACGCAVVSTATCMIPDIIQNGVDGFISNDEQELQGFLKTLLENDQLRETMGRNARRTILDNFSESNFITNWNNLFDNVYRMNK